MVPFFRGADDPNIYPLEQLLPDIMSFINGGGMGSPAASAQASQGFPTSPVNANSSVGEAATGQQLNAQTVPAPQFPRPPQRPESLPRDTTYTTPYNSGVNESASPPTPLPTNPSGSGAVDPQIFLQNPQDVNSSSTAETGTGLGSGELIAAAIAAAIGASQGMNVPRSVNTSTGAGQGLTGGPLVPYSVNGVMGMNPAELMIPQPGSVNPASPFPIPLNHQIPMLSAPMSQMPALPASMNQLQALPAPMSQLPMLPAPVNQIPGTQPGFTTHPKYMSAEQLGSVEGTPSFNGFTTNPADMTPEQIRMLMSTFR